ncbi:MAG: RHS repeat-associated core domain-containing protein [Candidatus Omnitrophica bacterium]|nr:RHS repeat-associated core domain-containing protein [Candidatus Omnitrophota bacterium]
MAWKMGLAGTTWTYTWNAENKLIRAASSSGKVIDYGYYDDGNLAFRQDSSGKVVYVYDGIHCIAEYDETGGLLKEYVYPVSPAGNGASGPNVDEVLCTLESSGGVSYYHQDALQSVVVLTDGFANEVVSYEYDIYGALTKTVGTKDNQILFTGRWLDSDTNLYYYRARWYDVSSGRFISRDPIGIMGGVNLYGYVGNEPVRFVDPLGLSRDVWGCQLLYERDNVCSNLFKFCVYACQKAEGDTGLRIKKVKWLKCIPCLKNWLIL